MKETTFEEKSGLRLFSLGIVIEGANPKRPPDEIIVSPIESMNIQTPGLMVTPKKEMRAGHPDEKGKVTKNKLEVQDYIRAKWISLNGSNRATPPTVYPNETVILYKYSNHDEYYWAPAMHEPHLRRKETASFSFSNMPAKNGWGKDGKPIAYDKSTSYWFEVDSFKKLVSLTTPKNDGEKAAYTISIDGSLGQVIISDDKGSSIVLTSNGPSISVSSGGPVRVTSGTEITIGSKSVYIGSSEGKGGLVKLDRNVKVVKDMTVNGDFYTNTIYCDKLIQGCGPTDEKFKEVTPKPVKKGPDGKDDPKSLYAQKGMDPNKPDKVTDWLLGITRPDGFYNEDGSVNPDHAGNPDDWVYNGFGGWDPRPGSGAAGTPDGKDTPAPDPYAGLTLAERLTIYYGGTVPGFTPPPPTTPPNYDDTVFSIGPVTSG